MSRVHYSEDCDDVLAYGRYVAALMKSIRGRRGQAFLKALLVALDEMPDKKLYAGRFSHEGEFCALGVLGSKRGINLDDINSDPDYERVASRFNIAETLAAEIMYLNDSYFVSDYKNEVLEIHGPMRPYWPEFGSHKRTICVPNPDAPSIRWVQMRRWVAEQIIES